ncbi:hypothetical protein Bca52824_040328 [Brassica carinata]|uniref:Cupin type-1 domain-containing protein n=1 Tax=Brassica carinata TaxID=52824 RepID=A0A8X7RR35_BRACI|nr:hypothetical protein Bca52824_040328 [Brassica carinata]
MSKFTIIPLCLLTLFLCTNSFSDQNDGVPSSQSPLLVRRHQRTQLVATEFGEISAVHIGEEYTIQFITLEPNALLLPLLLHSDMVFFVHTGSGVLNWLDKEKERTLELKRGDVFRLRYGTVFYLHCNLERDEVPDKLRVYAIFDVGKCLSDQCLGAYSSIRDLLWGFDEKTLRSAFAVPKDVFGRLRDAVKPPLITHAMPKNRTQGSEEETWGSRLAKLFVRVEDVTDHLEMKPVVNKKKKKKSSAYNVFESDPDFENDNGQSIVVDEKDMDALKGSSFGVYMVNLTKGSMMGPHWNPNACEISIVLQGEGMIRVVNHPSYQSKNESERFMVEDGDVFVVPQFYPMAQLSFVNSSFMFMGFSTSAKTNHPQFLVGQNSVLKIFNRDVLATSFNMRYETVERLLGAQKHGLMLECVSCAEVELSRLMREIEERRRREEEEIERRKRKREEARRQEEERRREEEAERKRKAEEEARKREEEREREEEAAKRREEERRRQRRRKGERKRKKRKRLGREKKQGRERRRKPRNGISKKGGSVRKKKLSVKEKQKRKQDREKKQGRERKRKKRKRLGREKKKGKRKKRWLRDERKRGRGRREKRREREKKKLLKEQRRNEESEKKNIRRGHRHKAHNHLSTTDV